VFVFAPRLIDPEPSLNPMGVKIVSGFSAGKSAFIGFLTHMSVTIGRGWRVRSEKVFY